MVATIPYSNTTRQHVFFLLKAAAIMLIVNLHTVCAAEFAITTKSGAAGRLGDELHLYSTARWLAYKYNLAFYPTPFQYSNFFPLSTTDTLIDAIPKKFLSSVVEVYTEDELIKHLKQAQEDTLFIIPFQIGLHFTANIVMRMRVSDLYTNMYDFTREHQPFGAALKAALTPKMPNPLALPADRITVAIHARKGSGDDGPVSSVQYNDEWEYITNAKIAKPKLEKGMDWLFPSKFPPEQFYVDQIINLSVLFNHAPMYVLVFTDDSNPLELIRRLKMRIPLPNIVFDCNPAKTKTRANDPQTIIEDICGMAQCDCLIRAFSGLSAAAQLIGNHKIVIYPQKGSWKAEPSLNQSMLQMNDVGLVFYDPNKHEALYFNIDEITDSQYQAMRQSLRHSILP